MKNEWKPFVAACAVVIGMYAYTAPLGQLEESSLNAADTNYNLLVQGFRVGQLNLKKEVPPRLARLADPYDPAANSLYQDFAYRLRDLSYYKGKLYTYFGVTPALILFWPFVALTGHYLFDRQAVTIFCAIGLLASMGLLRALWRRYFPEASVWVVAACALALGLVSGLPTMLPRSQIHEVAESCGYMLAMLSLGAIWCALHESERRAQWLVAASVAYGLAVGARPSLLFGAVILLVPVAQPWPEWRRVGRLLVAATVPITLIGLGLMVYNARRFGSPFEFGWRYQLASKRQVMMQSFSPRYLWFNFRVYFLEPARWSARFPFVRQITVPPLPGGYYAVDSIFGILTDTPLVWLALAAPLAWRRRSSQEASALRLFVGATALLFGVSALTVGLFCAASPRYAVDFLPSLVLLAVVGILGLERVLADRLAWRRAVRWGWGLLLGFSVAFSLLVSVVNYSHTACGLATVLALKGRVPEAIRVFENALRIEPDFADGHYNLGNAFMQTGKLQEAIREYECALRLKPDYADAHVNLGTALAKLGRSADATRHFEEAVRIKPDNPVAHYNIGYASYQMGRIPEAIEEFEVALQIWPDYAEAHNSLGGALLRTGNVPDAMGHYEQALRINPDYAEAHYNLGIALAQVGRAPEAIEHWEEALRINPDYAEAHYNLGVALAQAGRGPEAIRHWEQVLRLKPDDVDTHYNLGVALEKLGRTPEAIKHYQQALELRPDFTAARDALARLPAGQ